MNENLLPLKDFHLPPEPGFWPLAPGWWILIGLTFVALATALWFIRRQKHRAMRDYRREARLQLAPILTTFEADGNLQALSMNVNRLLKRIALSAISQSAARLTDEGWVAFLNEQLNTEKTAMDNATTIFLTKQPYTPTHLLTASQVDQALIDIEQWIDKHHGALLNADI